MIAGMLLGVGILTFGIIMGYVLGANADLTKSNDDE